jgi:uncharacterized protein DUF3551
MANIEMRAFASAILALTALMAASATASAQTYAPDHPVCIHVYGEELGDRIDCVFSSMAQCAAAASGLPATCLVNPYYAHVRQPQRPPQPRVE